jgi:hypothetical protein
MCAGPAHALVFENSVVNGGALTQSQLDQINEFYICASIEFQTRSRAPFICPLEQQSPSAKIKSAESFPPMRMIFCAARIISFDFLDIREN